MISESGGAAQLRVARGLDPIDAFRSRGEEDAALAAEAALQLGAREQRRELRLAAGSEQAQAIKRASDHAAINQLGTGIAEPAAEFEARLIEIARKAQTTARTARRIVDERLDQHRAEFRVDCFRRGRTTRQAQFRNARGDVLGLIGIQTKAPLDLDHGARAARL